MFPTHDSKLSETDNNLWGNGISFIFIVTWFDLFFCLLTKVIPMKLFYYQTFLETWHN